MTTVKTDTEYVMVVPTSLFHQCGYFQGFNPDTEKYLNTLLDPANTQYHPREKMEQDASFKQLIPYCIFRHTTENGAVSLFQYTRGKNQGEARLHAKRSIGIGGHISTLDLGDHSPYEVGMNRELNEEVSINSSFQNQCIGLINDDENDVGKVHLGIVHVFDVVIPDVTAKEADIIDAGFKLVSDVMREIQNYETWSQICLRALFQRSTK